MLILNNPPINKGPEPPCLSPLAENRITIHQALEAHTQRFKAINFLKNNLSLTITEKKTKRRRRRLPSNKIKANCQQTAQLNEAI
jgi:hypothetical protein